MRRYSFVDTTAYSQYLFTLACSLAAKNGAHVITNNSTHAATSAVYTPRRSCSTTSDDKKLFEFSNRHYGHFILPKTNLDGMLQSERVIYSHGDDKIIANKNGLNLYVAAEDKLYPLRAGKSYQAEGSDYIYIEFINHARGRFRIRDYSDAALESWRKLNSLNLDDLTPWISDGTYNVPAVAASASSQPPARQNVNCNSFDYFIFLFLSCVVASIAVYNQKNRIPRNAESQKQYLNLKYTGAYDSEDWVKYYGSQDISELEKSLNRMLESDHLTKQALYNDIKKFDLDFGGIYPSFRCGNYRGMYDGYNRVHPVYVSVPRDLLPGRGDFHRVTTYCMIRAFCKKYKEKYVTENNSGYIGGGFGPGGYGGIRWTTLDSYPEPKKPGI